MGPIRVAECSLPPQIVEYFSIKSILIQVFYLTTEMELIIIMDELNKDTVG